MTPSPQLSSSNPPFWSVEGPVRQAFFSRQGGISPAPYDSLNVAAHIGDDPSNALANRASALQAIGFEPERLVFLGQLAHGHELYNVGEAEAGTELGHRDALITTTPGLVLAVSVADCLTIALGDGQTVVALIHAGWRGLQSGVITEVVRAVRELTNADLTAVIGPGIGADNYEVGSEVAEQFPAESTQQDGSWYVDLRLSAHHQLEALGVNQVQDVAIDTFTNPDCFSYRREQGKTGRQLACTWL